MFIHFSQIRVLLYFKILQSSCKFYSIKIQFLHSHFSKYFILVRSTISLLLLPMYVFNFPFPYSFHFAVLNFLPDFPCSSIILLVPFLVLFPDGPSRHIALDFGKWFAWLLYHDFILCMDTFPSFNNTVLLRTNSRTVLIFFYFSRYVSSEVQRAKYILSSKSSNL